MHGVLNNPVRLVHCGWTFYSIAIRVDVVVIRE